MKAAHSPGLTKEELVREIESRGYKVKWQATRESPYCPEGWRSSGTTSWVTKTVYMSPWVANVRMALAHELEHVKGIPVVEQTQEEWREDSRCGGYTQPPFVLKVTSEGLAMVANGAEPSYVKRLLERKYYVRIVGD